MFPGGSEIGLEIQKSLKDCKEIILYSANSNIPNHAPHVFKRHVTIPDIYSDNWISLLNEYIDAHEIDYIFPAYDDVIEALAQNADSLNARIISSPLSTCLVCRSKLETYKIFKDLMPVPRVFNKLSDVDSFPVFVKPDKGQSSKNACKVSNLEMLKALMNDIPGLIIMENLPGKEYTVDCFSHRRQGLLFCSGRERISIKNGISMVSKPVNNDLFLEYAKIISEKLTFHGAWFFQVKYDGTDNLKLLEIAPRVSGTMATHRVSGINFPQLSIYEMEDFDLEIMMNNYKVEINRALTNRYQHDIKYNNIYVDLDDTLILNEKLNIQLIGFLYQSLNADCKIILITKTINDIEAVLNQYRIRQLFDEVICLTKEDSKADYIKPESSIFIDDSYSERKSVADALGIPTFDCSMIEVLIDDRV